MDRLYAALQRDPRHTDLKVLDRQPIDRTSFAAWSMKYVPLDAPMQALLQRQGLATFDPYRFDAATVAAVLDMLRTGGDVAPEPSVAPAPAPDAGAARAFRLAAVALAVALVALLVAVLT